MIIEYSIKLIQAIRFQASAISEYCIEYRFEYIAVIG